MNKKEISEIKKQFTPENCAITRICGCYINGDKEIKTQMKEAFLSLPEEEVFKYCTIFKQTLSGTIGKNLINMEFPLEQEKEGGTQEFLLKLRESELKDDSLIQEFFTKVIENFEYGENYYIILIHAAYDIPGKASDGIEMEDASDHVYNHLLCSICPVKLSKPGLSYDVDKNQIKERTRDWVVEPPMKGFLFPAFTDRDTDIHSALYYSKNPEELQPEFIDKILGTEQPLTAEGQKESFQALITDTLGNDCDYNVVKNIHENLNQMIEERKDDPEPLELTGQDVKRLLETSGVPEEKMETFEEEYASCVGEKASLLATNLINTKRFEIETPDIVIHINPERTDLIETRLIDGKQCLVIEVNDHIEVNGVSVKTIPNEITQE